MVALRDDDESPTMMEPMRIPQDSDELGRLSELAFSLAKRSAAFNAALPHGLAEPLSDFVRSMNCYYSNLIEGHNTHPVDIDRAMNNDYSSNKQVRDLQHEAKSHICVQKWIDDGNIKGKAASVVSIINIHKLFIENLPDDMRWVEEPDTKRKEEVIPGEFRKSFAQVGRHITISPGAVPRFLARFESAYSDLGDFETILTAAVAHHRLLWIHPFSDGNGRVTRLVSYAMLSDALGTGGLWSIARGLARNSEVYKRSLAACDAPRQGDRDGRGNLSLQSVTGFTAFFLRICVDQVEFMEKLMEPKAVRARILQWAEEERRYSNLPQSASKVLDAILFRGSLPRSEVPSVIGLSERSGHSLMKALSAHGIVKSEGARADWKISFPAKLAARLMPSLYPEPKPVA